MIKLRADKLFKKEISKKNIFGRSRIVFFFGTGKSEEE